MTKQTDAPIAPRGVIVVGVDFSPTCDRIVAASFGLAHQNPGADIHLVHVAATRTESVGDKALRDAGLSHLDGALQKIAQHHFSETRIARPRIFTHLLQGDAAREIVQLATDVHADLVVVGTHAQSDGISMTLGSVTSEILRIAPCTVLSVKPKHLPLAPDIRPPCPACLALQAEAGPPALWCERHRHAHPSFRVYAEEPSPYGSGAMSIHES